MQANYKISLFNYMPYYFCYKISLYLIRYIYKMKDSLINHINKFVNLDEQETELVCESVNLVTVKKKQFILTPDEICRANFFVTKGCMRLYFINRNGQEQITQFGLENWWITDYASLETGKPSNYYIQAIEDAELISIKKKTL